MAVRPAGDVPGGDDCDGGGLLAQQGDLDMSDVFQFLRRYARDRNQRLTDVARAMVSRALTAQQVLEHAQTRVPRTGRTPS